MAKSVTLHIGLPKTGSTSLQRALAANAELLASAGIHYPLREGAFNHRAEVADLQQRWVRPLPGNARGYQRITARALPGSWKQLCHKLEATAGEVIVSNEALSSFSPAAAAAAVSDLTESRVRPLRVLMVVRPLSDLLPSAYSQHALDTLMPTFEIWARASLGYQLRSLETDPFFWMYAKCVLNNWRATGAEVVTVVYSRGPELESALLAALGINEVVSRPFMGGENRSLSAAALGAWQRHLRTGVNGLDSRVKELLRRWRESGPDLLNPAIGGRFTFRPDIAELIDTAFPISATRNASGQEAPAIAAARSTLAKRLASTAPLCFPGPEGGLVDDLYNDIRARDSGTLATLA